jgi:hypothetical protein
VVQVGNQECGVEAGSVIWLGEKQYDVRARRHSADSAVIEQSDMGASRCTRSGFSCGQCRFWRVARRYTRHHHPGSRKMMAEFIST